MNKQEKDIIRCRCPRCEYGAWHYDEIRCSHSDHPGYIGGSGTEWACYCPSFKDSGGVGRVIETVVRTRNKTPNSDPERGRSSYTIFKKA